MFCIGIGNYDRMGKRGGKAKRLEVDSLLATLCNDSDLVMDLVAPGETLLIKPGIEMIIISLSDEVKCKI